MYSLGFLLQWYTNNNDHLSRLNSHPVCLHGNKLILTNYTAVAEKVQSSITTPRFSFAIYSNFSKALALPNTFMREVFTLTMCPGISGGTKSEEELMFPSTSQYQNAMK